MHSECINCPNTYTDDGAMYPIDQDKCRKCTIVPCKDLRDMLKPMYPYLDNKRRKHVCKLDEWFRERVSL